MGPHVFACGNIDMSDDTGGVELVASMGPHVFACGNRATQRALYAERSLQWGRTFLRAEILGATMERCGRPTGFNGAARFCVRKSEAGKIGGETTRELQWGRTFLRAEIACSSGTPLVELKLQWGRTFLRAEI